MSIKDRTQATTGRFMLTSVMYIYFFFSVSDFLKGFNFFNQSNLLFFVSVLAGLPFSELINDDHTLISKNKILEKFKSLNLDFDKNLVFSCGSGVTASVLALAYSLINDKYMPTIYDGSWSEYGRN